MSLAGGASPNAQSHSFSCPATPEPCSLACPGETRNQPSRELTCEELFPAAALQYRCSGLCCERGVIAQPWCGSTAWLLDTAQGNSPHLYSREVRAAPAPWHSVPGGMSLSPPSSFCAGLQLWCFHSALCCRNHSRALGLLCISWKEGTTQEGRPQHQSVSMCKEIPDTVQGLYGI